MNTKIYLITGGAGFIGSNLIRKILKHNPQAIIYVIEPQGINLWRLVDIAHLITIHHISLTNIAELTDLIESIKPQIIFHLASYGGMPNQIEQSLIFDINLLGTINLLSACKKVNFECFINTGSSSEYGKKSYPMKEQDILEPISDYAIAKAAATHYCLKEAIMCNLPVYTIRPFSVYGDYEALTRLIPTVALGFLTQNPLYLSKPTNVRDFIYIDDMVEAYLCLATKRPLHSYIFNIGSGIESSIQHVINIIQSITKTTPSIHWQATAPRPWEPTHWQADIHQAQTILNWTPSYSLEQGLLKTVQWLEKNQNLYLSQEVKNNGSRNTTSINPQTRSSSIP
ncbi:NAD-dependent epimerase/dehydratase family protein [Candidatus Dependentiae bacterium]|nr:NAD-dependent epimerase/dehydratase family protein [Candidatus Dependentiae bacterium]